MAQQKHLVFFHAFWVNFQLSVSIEIYLDNYILTSRQYERERRGGGGGGGGGAGGGERKRQTDRQRHAKETETERQTDRQWETGRHVDNNNRRQRLMQGTKRTCVRHSTNTFLLKQTDHRLYPNSKLDTFNWVWISADEPQFANEYLGPCDCPIWVLQHDHRTGHGPARTLHRLFSFSLTFDTVGNTVGKFKEIVYVFFFFPVCSLVVSCLLLVD